jgi:hypothetical protein
VKILSRFPFSDKFASISFQNAAVELKPFQIVVWVSISTGQVDSRIFPAFLDTGHNETFSISAQQLRDWAGIDYTKLRLLPGVRMGKHLLPVVKPDCPCIEM